MENLQRRLNRLSEEQRTRLLQRLLEKRAAVGRAEVIPRRSDASGYCPVSFGQELMWLLNQLTPSHLYNAPECRRINGPLNVDALEQALRTIVARHEALRTSYEFLDGQLFQRVSRDWSLEMPRIDLTTVPEDEREREAQRIVSQEAQRPFNLSRDLMLRPVLLKLGPQEHILVLALHHIAVDGWSKQVIYRELEALYEAFCHQQASPLPDPPIQYADFALWQRQQLSAEFLEKEVSYWKQRLANVPALLELPSDHPRPPVMSYRGNRERAMLSRELLEGFRSLSRREGVSLFMTLLAAFKTLLYRYTGQEDMVVGTFIANRNRPELENVVGYFSNTLVLRSDLSGDPTFREFLARVRETCLEAYEHQDFPFEKLVLEMKPPRDLSYIPLCQVTLNLQNDQWQDMRLSNTVVTQVRTERYSAKFDLVLALLESSDGLQTTIEYNTDLFTADTIRRMLGHWQTLLEAIVDNPEQRLSLLPLLGKPERRQLLVEWNNTQADYPDHRCVHQLFEAQVEQTPAATAVVFAEQRLTYHELNVRANKLAHYLKKLGVGPNRTVAVCLPRSWEMIVAILGVLKAGGTYIPLAAEYTRRQLPALLKDTQVQVLVTSQRIRKEITLGNKVGAVCLESDWPLIERESPENPAHEVTADSLAYIVLTSGSTGLPKGVMINHRSLSNAYFAWEDAYQLKTPPARHLQVANFSFDVFTGDVVRSLCSGGSLVLCPFEVVVDPAKLYRLMVEEKIDCVELVPDVLRGLMEYLSRTGESLKFLRLLVVGSDVWYAEECAALQKLCGEQTRLINSYGVAEATIDSSYFEARGSLPASGVVPIGRPFNNTRLYILDPHQQPVPIGVMGELYIGGRGVAHGYLNQETLTDEKFIRNPFSQKLEERLYRTGDFARYLPDGNVQFAGRRDYQIKIRGFRVELAGIEAALNQHPSVRQAVVTAHGDTPAERHLIAYLVTERDHSVGSSDLRAFLQQRLPAYMLPSTFVILDSFPITPNGKVDRNRLPIPKSRQSLASKPGPRPRTQEEKVLAGIWSEVLKVSSVGIHDNFFDLGGHSLMATQVISRVREQLGVELPMLAIFEGPTISELGKVLSQLRTSGTSPAESSVAVFRRDLVPRPREPVNRSPDHEPPASSSGNTAASSPMARR